MKVLGIDCSLNRLNLGLSENGRTISESSRNAEGILTEIFTDEISDLLKGASVGLSDLSAIAITTGPGSFTGLRVGLATVKAICWSRKLPLVTMSTFEAVAYQFRDRKNPISVICPSHDKKLLGGNFHTLNGLPQLQGELFIAEPDEIAKKVTNSLTVIDIGIHPHLGEIRKFLPRGAVLINNEQSYLTGSTVAGLGTQMFERGLTTDPKDAEPIYLQKTIYRSKH